MRSIHSWKKVVLLTIALAFAACTCSAQGRGPSTPEERARVVKVTRALEVNPLSKELRSEREWALRWLIEVPDISVALCSKLPDVLALKKFKHDADLFVLTTLSQATFIIENPDKAKDRAASSLAGMESMLKAYEAILKGNPKLKAKYLDDLLEKRNSGELPEFVRDLAAGCK